MIEAEEEAAVALSTNRLYAGQKIPDGMTKSAFKRLKRQERMEADREDFTAKRKQKRRDARKRNPTRRRMPQKSSDRKPSGVSVVIDCGFDGLMTDSERTSLAGQLTRCYSQNRRCMRSVDLTISGFTGKLESRFENEMHGTHKLWDQVTFCKDDVLLASGSNAVYLTGDADDVLDSLDPGTTYFIGGIVDKNRYTNLCLDKARKIGIRTAKLPIDEHIKVSGRRVLTTNQAFELLLRWLELKDWKLAFEAAIPARKLFKEDQTDAASSVTRSEDEEDTAEPRVSETAETPSHINENPKFEEKTE